ncbi:hypothetical protein FH972_011713 [Carpinus fangiana]|uniref:Uncharacterized protein n=1 Tax=Carpinus fangiana TaxID=176857 RepID=A0A660KV87_9ROSI|nr:hypothetical protein FH972_011713 [Carpinus fangiana]
MEWPIHSRKQGRFHLTFCNKTKNPRMSCYIGDGNCYFESFEDHIFVHVLRYDKIEHRLEMKSGDEIELSVYPGDLNEVKKCGIHLAARS